MSGIGGNPGQELKGKLGSSLTELIKEDLRSFGRFAAGIGYGLVTPFALWTGLAACNRAMNSASAADIAGWWIGLIGGHSQLAYWAIEAGRGKEYLGAIVALNAVDYAVHLARRYKQERERDAAKKA